MGIAASLAVGDKWWWETQAFTLRRLTGELTAITRKGISLSLMSMDKVAVGDWLTANKAPRLTVLPAKLNELPRKGCHLYTTPSAGLVNPPAARAGVAMTREGDLTLATWAAEGQTLLLVSHEAPELVRSLIG